MQRISSLDDPRIAPYRNLRDRTLRGESLFIAEGVVLVRRLLGSGYGVESVFAAEGYAAEFERLLPAGVPLYVAPESLLLNVVGFNFHRGALAVGCRPEPRTLEAVVPPKPPGTTRCVVICPEVTKPENLGLICRSAAALGADGVLLGSRCCDPLSRRALRVSMGAVLQIPWVKSPTLLEDLARLKNTWGFKLLGAVVDANAQTLPGLDWPQHTGIVLGNESAGLPRECLEQCDQRVTIPMAPGVDSLNLGVAGSVFLYEWRRAALGNPAVAPKAPSCPVETK